MFLSFSANTSTLMNIVQVQCFKCSLILHMPWQHSNYVIEQKIVPNTPIDRIPLVFKLKAYPNNTPIPCVEFVGGLGYAVAPFKQP